MRLSNQGTQSSPDFEITIEKLVYGGAGLGRHAGKVVFVPFSAPGDRLLVRPADQRKNFIRATIVRIIEPGPGRADAGCAHFGRCGGCQWQHLEYRHQVEAKRKILEEVLHHRFPETSSMAIRMKASPQPYGYRSRARLQVRGFGTHSTAGFCRLESHSVEDVETCPLFRPLLNSALSSIRESRRRGECDAGSREVELACSHEQGIWKAVEIGLSPGEDYSSRDGLEHGAAEEISLRRTIAGFEFAVSPTTFFQANDFMVEELVSDVCGLAGGFADGEALDLYCGVGLFSLPLARRFKKVVSVESSPQACRLCHRNAAAAGIENVRIVPAEVASWLNSVNSVAPPGFDLVILDPPRSGAGADVMRLLAQCAPETIIYVSCDHQTLCRDVALLPSRDYRIDFVEGLDLFPQTYHLETVMRLTRR